MEQLLRQYAAKYNIPYSFLVTLAIKESDMNPRSWSGSASSGRGVLQITPVVLNDYNKRHGTNISPNDLFDPETNIKIATELIHRIKTNYAKYKSLQTDWSSPRWVELVVFGWNAGWAGLTKIVSNLEKLGFSSNQVTIEAVAKNAAGYTHLQNPKKVSWSKGVAAAFLKSYRPLSIAFLGVLAIGAYLLLRR